MDLTLTGKRALVTGSTGGIGEGIAKTLAREGAAVVVQGRNESAGRRVQQQIEAAGGKVVVAIGDLSTEPAGMNSEDGPMPRLSNGSTRSIRTSSPWCA